MQRDSFSGIDLRDETLSLCTESAVHYQPIVDLARREVVGAEALLGGSQPERGQRQPAALGAEGLLETACRQGAAWAAQGLDLEMSVALSVRQVTEPTLVEEVRDVLATTALAPQQLLLEVSEAALTDELRGSTVLDELAALGVRLGLDHFGTGHSSLLYLKRYPIAALKIDTTFVTGLGANRDDEAVVASVASLSTWLGARCTAAGVETPEQLAHLLALRCQAQGLLFAPAVPASELPAAVDLAEGVLEAARPPRSRARARRGWVELPSPLREQIHRMHVDGASLQTIASALNQAGTLHPKGTRWHASSVARCLSDAALSRRASDAR